MNFEEWIRRLSNNRVAAIGVVVAILDILVLYEVITPDLTQAWKALVLAALTLGGALLQRSQASGPETVKRLKRQNYGH